MATPYRYTSAVSKREATGLVAGVYAQIDADFILADGPLMSLSPAPDLLATAWSALREAQVAGSVPRVEKELVAAAVSVVNRCPFCIGAHSTLLHATGHHELAETLWNGGTPGQLRFADLVVWARATIAPGSAALAAPPFPEAAAAEYLGTALITHFITRITSALVDERALAVRLQSSALVRRVAGKAFARVVQRQAAAGKSLPLLAGLEPGAPAEWAEGSPIGIAFNALKSAAARGAGLLSDRAAAEALSAIGEWNGAYPPDSGAALEPRLAGLPAADRPGARLAVLAGLAPHLITAADVAAWRSAHPGDADLVRIVAFGAMAAVERIEGWITAGRLAGAAPRDDRFITGGK